MFKGKPVVDVHGHVSTPVHFRAFAMNLIIGAPGARDGQLSMSDDLMETAQKPHVERLDEYNIDVQFISPRPVAMMLYERPHIVRKWSATTNDVIHQACRLYPERFRGIAQLPQQSSEDTSNCLEELERCVKELGFVGATISPDPGGERQTPGMDQEYWFPLYDKAQSLGAALTVHGTVSKDGRSDSQFTSLVEQTLATEILSRGDVFRQFPRLKIIVCHCGGAPSRFLPASRTSGQEGGGQIGTSIARETPAEDIALSDNLFFDTCAYDKWYLTVHLKQKGAHQFLFGTEAPGSGTATLNVETGRPSDDVLPVIDGLDFLTDEQKISICCDRVNDAFPLFATP
jgi:predicted TIM-barrel fold metal-dependent hydrolase